MLFKKIKLDFSSALSGSNGQIKPPFTAMRIATVLTSFEFFVVFFFRFYSYLYGFTPLRILSMSFYQLSKFILKCDIHPSAKIGGGLHLVHGFNVVIGADAILGENVCLFDGVSIGKKNVGMIDGMPNIGNDVIIGSGAKVLGRIYIKDNVLIGANSVVIKSVLESNVTVAGIPAKIVSGGV